LFPQLRLLHHLGKAFTIVVPGEDEFPTGHRGSAIRVERRRRCVWRLDRGEMAGEWLGHGWMGEKMEGN
jgi:hypothetical protein